MKRRGATRVTVVEAVTVEHVEGCACEKGPSPFEAWERNPFEAAEPNVARGQHILSEPWWGKRERPLLQREIDARLRERGYRTDFVDHARTTDLSVDHGGDGVHAVITFGFYRPDAPPSAIYVTGTGSEKLRKQLRAWGFYVDTSAPTAAGEVPTGDCIVVRDGEVERGPGCRPTNVDLTSWKDVHKIMRKRFDGQGVEIFYVLASSTQDQLVGEPMLVAKGQVSGVRVDVDSCLIAMLALRSGGGVTFYVCHNHPGSVSHAPSDADKDLTRKIKKGFDAALPAAKWGGHVVCGRDGCSLA